MARPTEKNAFHRHCIYETKWAFLALYLIILFISPIIAHASDVPIQVKGLKNSLLANAKGHLASITVKCGAPRWQVDSALIQARQQVQQALEALGYYQPIITPKLSHQNACWHISLTVKPGQPIRIKKIKLSLAGPGKQNPGFRKILGISALKTGQILDQGKYSTLKQNLQTYAHAHGYFDAHFTEHSIQVNKAKHSAQITLTFETGKRYAFGKTIIESHSLNPQLIRGFLNYHPGEPYNSNTLVESQNALMSSGYFDNVRLQTLVKNRVNGKVPVRLSTTPARRYQLLTGIGYATDTGPALRLDFRNHRVNRAGHRYALNLQLARIQSQATAHYEIPLSNPRFDWLSFQSGYQYQNTLAAQSRTWKLSVAHNHLMLNGWIRRFSLEYLNENSSIAGQTLSGHFLIPSIGFSRTTAYDVIYPERGWSIHTTLSGAVKRVISTQSFIQAKIDAKSLTPMFGGHILTRLTLGATAVKDLTQLPTTLRFFAGGARSIRGYSYQSLGPNNNQGILIGGRYIAVGSLEFEHHLTGPFYWSVFYDLGNAFDAWPFTVRQGLGVGINWHSPLGPIKIDFARPLNPLPGGRHFAIQVSMGPVL